MNIHSDEMLDENKRLIACIDLYFVEDDGGRFKVSVPFKPYFYIRVRENNLIHELRKPITLTTSENVKGMAYKQLVRPVSEPSHLPGALSVITWSGAQKLYNDELPVWYVLNCLYPLGACLVYVDQGYFVESVPLRVRDFVTAGPGSGYAAAGTF